MKSQSSAGRIAVLGAGSWGTTLANHLAGLFGGGAGNLVQGNYIGTNAAGSADEREPLDHRSHPRVPSSGCSTSSLQRI